MEFFLKPIYSLFIYIENGIIYMDDITRHKISNTLSGRKRSATTINLIKQALKGRKLSDKHKRHISEAMQRRKLKRALRNY